MRGAHAQRMSGDLPLTWSCASLHLYDTTLDDFIEVAGADGAIQVVPIINGAEDCIDLFGLEAEPLAKEFRAALGSIDEPAPAEGVGFASPDHTAQGSVWLEGDVAHAQGKEFGAPREEVIAN